MPEEDTAQTLSRGQRHDADQSARVDRRVVLGATAMGVAGVAAAAYGLTSGRSPSAALSALDGLTPGTSAGSSATMGSAADSTSGSTASGWPTGAPATTMPVEPDAAPPPASRSAARTPSAGNPAPDRDASYAQGSKTPASPAGVGAPGAAAASRRTAPKPLVNPTTGMTADQVSQRHLLSRATFGARPQDYGTLATQGIDRWLAEQLNPESLPDPSASALRAAFPLAGKGIADVRRSVERYSWDASFQTAQWTLGRQLFSTHQLYEVVVDLFANLLNVTTPSDKVWDSAADYQSQVIRKNAFGRYADMLAASMRHPAMLSYLDNDESTRRSVNENLGRELLELHSVGVASGYTETDVRHSAYILSGRTVDDNGQFRFSAGDHWTGAVKVLGFSHANASAADGLAVGDAYVNYLARHAATARTVARKIAVRFVSDNPPDTLVERLAKAYLDNDTKIVAVLQALFASTEFWAAVEAKTRRPHEDLVGAARALDVAVGGDLRAGVESLYWNLGSLGQAPLGWAPPNGYPDVTAAWMSASQMIGRWNGHLALAGGWWKGLRPSQPLTTAAAPAPGQTNGAWIDSLARRVIGRPLPDQHRAALVEFLGVSAGAAADRGQAWKTPHLAALMLDSSLFQLR